MVLEKIKELSKEYNFYTCYKRFFYYNASIGSASIKNAKTDRFLKQNSVRKNSGEREMKRQQRNFCRGWRGGEKNGCPDETPFNAKILRSGIADGRSPVSEF